MACNLETAPLLPPAAIARTLRFAVTAAPALEHALISDEGVPWGLSPAMPDDRTARVPASTRIAGGKIP